MVVFGAGAGAGAGAAAGAGADTVADVFVERILCDFVVEVVVVGDLVVLAVALYFLLLFGSIPLLENRYHNFQSKK